jgi:hypothetical protein
VARGSRGPGGEARGDRRLIEDGGSNLWGVEAFSDGGRDVIAVSDRHDGLRIFRYTAADRVSRPAP